MYIQSETPAWSGSVLESWVVQLPHNLCCTTHLWSEASEVNFWGSRVGQHKQRDKTSNFLAGNQEWDTRWTRNYGRYDSASYSKICNKWESSIMGKGVKSSQFQAKGHWSQEFGHFSVCPVLPHIVIKETSATTYSLAHCRSRIYVEQSQDCIGLWKCGHLHISGYIWCQAGSMMERIGDLTSFFFSGERCRPQRRRRLEPDADCSFSKTDTYPSFKIC